MCSKKVARSTLKAFSSTNDEANSVIGSRQVSSGNDSFRNVRLIKILYLFKDRPKLPFNQGESPGLVVMGGDSRSRGHGFAFQHQILDGHNIVAKVVMGV